MCLKRLGGAIKQMDLRSRSNEVQINEVGARGLIKIGAAIPTNSNQHSKPNGDRKYYIWSQTRVRVVSSPRRGLKIQDTMITSCLKVILFSFSQISSKSQRTTGVVGGYALPHNDCHMSCIHSFRLPGEKVDVQTEFPIISNRRMSNEHGRHKLP